MAEQQDLPTIIRETPTPETYAEQMGVFDSATAAILTDSLINRADYTFIGEKPVDKLFFKRPYDVYSPLAYNFGEKSMPKCRNLGIVIAMEIGVDYSDGINLPARYVSLGVMGKARRFDLVWNVSQAGNFTRSEIDFRNSKTDFLGSKIFVPQVFDISTEQLCRELTFVNGILRFVSPNETR